MNCKYCGKVCKNLNSLRQHEIRCIENPERLIQNRKGKNNPMYGKKGKNQYSKAKEENREYIPTEKMITFQKKRSMLGNKARWSKPGASERMSKKIKEAIKKNPDAYSASNISGRVKSYNVKDSFGNETKVKGTWELTVAKYLNEQNIKWVNKLQPIPYFWNGRDHLYFPDFYLPDFDFYIEVKGYERERDRAKWKAVKNLIVFKYKEINMINEKNCDVAEWLKAHLS